LTRADIFVRRVARDPRPRDSTGLLLQGGDSESGAGFGASGDDGDGVVDHAFGEMGDVMPEAPGHLRAGRERIPVLVLELVTGCTAPSAGGQEVRGDEVIGDPAGVHPSLAPDAAAEVHGIADLLHPRDHPASVRILRCVRTVRIDDPGRHVRRQRAFLGWLELVCRGEVRVEVAADVPLVVH